MIYELSYASARDDEIRLSHRRETVARKVAELACLRLIGQDYPDTVGIVGYTDKGEMYPELWLDQQDKLRPHMFSYSVANSVIGHCSVALGLRGPQIVVSDSTMDLQVIAELQIKRRRAFGMIVLREVSVHEVSAVLIRRSLHV